MVEASERRETKVSIENEYGNQQLSEKGTVELF